MKRLFAIVFCVLFVSTSLFAQRQKKSTPKFVPQDNKVLLFCGQNNNDSDEFVKIHKKIPAGFMFYTSLADLSGLDDTADFGAGKTCGKYITQKYKGTALQIGLYLVNSLEDVVSGALDDNIKELAKWIKDSKAPVFLRIGYEFDLPENNYDPILYKKAFQYIVDKMEELNVKNVAYVWHSCASYNPKKIEEWYPGDEYVDWCAITYFSNSDCIKMLKFSQRHNKPFMIAECAPTLNYSLKYQNKLNWYKKLFGFIKNNNVKALCYINANWDEQPMFSSYNWGNSKINESKKILDFWFENIKDKRYIFFDNLYKTINYQPMQQALIVFCHPDNKNSSNAKILNKVEKVFKENDVKCIVRDLYAMKFNPVLSKSELQKIKNNEELKDYKKEVRYFKDSDLVVFIYPIWWNSMPAMLKGYVDKVFSLNFAYENYAQSINSKKAIVFNTMATSKEDLQSQKQLLATINNATSTYLLEYAGFKVLSQSIFCGFNNVDKANIETSFKEIESTCLSIINEK